MFKATNQLHSFFFDQMLSIFPRMPCEDCKTCLVHTTHCGSLASPTLTSSVALYSYCQDPSKDEFPEAGSAGLCPFLGLSSDAEVAAVLGFIRR